MDGLLIDSEKSWYEASLICSEECGYNIPGELVLKTMGLNEAETTRQYKEALGEDFPFHRFVERTLQLQTAYLEKHPLEKKKGLDELFAYLDKNGIKKAVATSNSKIYADESLESVGILDRFDHITYGDDLKESKPRPEIYLKAAGTFDIPKKNILAFEDSNNGILSAYNAGLKVVHIPDMAIVEEDTRKKCFAVLNNLSEAIELIEKINSL